MLRSAPLIDSILQDSPFPIISSTLMTIIFTALVIDYSMSYMFIMLAKSFSCSYGNPNIYEPAIQM